MIVVVLVALGQGADPSTQALTAAAQDGLGPVALIVVREAPPESLAEHANSEKTGELLHADAVATVEWNDDEHEHAHVAVYSTHDHAWQDRSVSFTSGDALTERGRQLGFGIASMVPPSEVKPPPPPEDRPPRDQPPTPPPDANEPPRIAIDLVGIGQSAVAGGFGVELSPRWRTWKGLWLRSGVGIRFGSIAAADASFVDLRFDAGPALTLITIASLDVGMRADFVATHLAVKRDASTSNATGSHFSAGTDLQLEVAYGLSRYAAIVLAGGPELDFGVTHIVVDGAEVEHVPPLHFVGEVGARVRF